MMETMLIRRLECIRDIYLYMIFTFLLCIVFNMSLWGFALGMILIHKWVQDLQEV